MRGSEEKKGAQSRVSCLRREKRAFSQGGRRYRRKEKKGNENLRYEGPFGNVHPEEGFDVGNSLEKRKEEDLPGRRPSLPREKGGGRSLENLTRSNKVDVRGFIFSAGAHKSVSIGAARTEGI